MASKKKIPKGQDTLFENLTLPQVKGKIIKETLQFGKKKPDLNAGTNLVAAIERYLSQFRHRRCGGNPVAYVYANGSSCLGCSKCDLKQPVGASEPLGQSVQHSNWEVK